MEKHLSKNISEIDEKVIYRMQTSFLPGRGITVEQKVAAYAMHRFSLDNGAVLEKGGVYLVPLLESLKLHDWMAATANPKSSTGRLDVFCRLITDSGTEFDHVGPGYFGPLWVEISPRSFSILVETGARLLQLRIKSGESRTSDVGLRELHAEIGLISDDMVFEQNLKHGTLAITVAAQTDTAGEIIGWRARKNTGLIDVSKVTYYDPQEFWEPLHVKHGEGLILDPNDFYILSSNDV